MAHCNTGEFIFIRHNDRYIIQNIDNVDDIIIYGSQISIEVPTYIYDNMNDIMWYCDEIGDEHIGMAIGSKAVLYYRTRNTIQECMCISDEFHHTIINCPNLRIQAFD